MTAKPWKYVANKTDTFQVFTSVPTEWGAAQVKIAKGVPLLFARQIVEVPPLLDLVRRLIKTHDREGLQCGCVLCSQAREILDRIDPQPPWRMHDDE